MNIEPEVRSFPGIVYGDGQVAIPLHDPDGEWWVLGNDGISHWEGPDALRTAADGMVAEGIDDLEPGVAAGYRALADLIDRLGTGEVRP